MSKPYDILAFGEMLLRLSPQGMERMVQSEIFEKNIGGSEFNVASGIAQFGLKSGFISKIPNNMMGRYARNKLRLMNTDDRYLLDDDSDSARLGVYYYERGAFPKKPSACYDRANSSVTTFTLDDLPEEVYPSTRHFHVSGISLALGENLRNTILEMTKRFKKQGATISFDVNYRANLWDEQTAKKSIEAFLPLVDYLFVSEETSRRMLGRTGTLDHIMKSYCDDYEISMVAVTQRKVLSPTKHSFGSTLYVSAKNEYFTDTAYENIEIIDRIGSGDAYLAGFLSAMLEGRTYREMLERGNAASAYKNTIPGDMLIATRSEIEQIIVEHHATTPVSELNR